MENMVQWSKVIKYQTWIWAAKIFPVHSGKYPKKRFDQHPTIYFELVGSKWKAWKQHDSSNYILHQENSFKQNQQNHITYHQNKLYFMQASKGHQPQMPDFNVFIHYQSQDLHLWDLFENLCGKLCRRI